MYVAYKRFHSAKAQSEDAEFRLQSEKVNNGCP